ncbi:MAG: DUF6273 domain-containing protein [bacterium]|nr:DUF6273 domain-containing protein [bacterium]
MKIIFSIAVIIAFISVLAYVCIAFLPREAELRIKVDNVADGLVKVVSERDFTAEDHLQAGVCKLKVPCGQKLTVSISAPHYKVEDIVVPPIQLYEKSASISSHLTGEDKVLQVQIKRPAMNDDTVTVSANPEGIEAIVVSGEDEIFSLPVPSDVKIKLSVTAANCNTVTKELVIAHEDEPPLQNVTLKRIKGTLNCEISGDSSAKVEYKITSGKNVVAQGVFESDLLQKNLDLGKSYELKVFGTNISPVTGQFSLSEQKPDAVCKLELQNKTFAVSMPEPQKKPAAVSMPDPQKETAAVSMPEVQKKAEAKSNNIVLKRSMGTLKCEIINNAKQPMKYKIVSGNELVAQGDVYSNLLKKELKLGKSYELKLFGANIITVSQKFRLSDTKPDAACKLNVKPKPFLTGTYTTFGRYPQNKGNTPEPIQWLVLENNGSTALLISKYALECRPFHHDSLILDGDDYYAESATWLDCDLRKWLNRDFMNKAFNASEKSRIRESVLYTYDNEWFGTKGCGKTHDKIFCFSIEEYEKYFPNHELGMCSYTEFAGKQFSRNNHNRDYKNYFHTSNCDYWLRSPGELHEYKTALFGTAAYVSNDGYVNMKGFNLIIHICFVRPALRVSVK